MSWRDELARDGITLVIKRQLFEILGNQPEITARGIEEALYGRGHKRVNMSKIKKFMAKTPEIRLNEKYNETNTYSLEK